MLLQMFSIYFRGCRDGLARTTHHILLSCCNRKRLIFSFSVPQKRHQRHSEIGNGDSICLPTPAPSWTRSTSIHRIHLQIVEFFLDGLAKNLLRNPTQEQLQCFVHAHNKNLFQSSRGVLDFHIMLSLWRENGILQQKTYRPMDLIRTFLGFYLLQLSSHQFYRICFRVRF